MQLKEYITNINNLLMSIDKNKVQALIDSIYEAYQAENFVFIIGNGGSGANASHLCEDLGMGTLTDFKSQKRLKVISLTDNTPYILAWANDTDYSMIFVEQLKNLAQKNALLIQN